MTYRRPFPGRWGKFLREAIWPAIGIVAVVVSVLILYDELRSISADDVIDSLAAISWPRYGLAAAAAAIAYAGLAWYDAIALRHLRVRHISWRFVALASFTAYALAHNIGASLFSAAMVRYRAYTSRGLGGTQIALLIAFASLTFILGMIAVAGCVLVLEPELLLRFEDALPDALATPEAGLILGIVLILLIAIYLGGAILSLPPLVLGRFRLDYPAPAIALRQVVAGPLEIVAAAAVIYYALPAGHEVGFVVILGVFLAAFAAALISHAPGGLGVFELVFISALPDFPPEEVLAALIVFRAFYLLVPLAISLVIVALFERSRYRARESEKRS